MYLLYNIIYVTLYYIVYNIYIYILYTYRQKGSSAGTIEVHQRGSPSLVIYAMPTKWCMHGEWHKILCRYQIIFRLTV